MLMHVCALMAVDDCALNRRLLQVFLNAIDYAENCVSACLSVCLSVCPMFVTGDCVLSCVLTGNLVE